MTKEKKTELTKIEKLLLSLSIIFGILGLIVLIGSIFLFNNEETINLDKKINSDKFGSFGSFISGAVGTIWSLVSVILFYLTLGLQRKELALQRDELVLTRNELIGQKTQMIKQNQTLSHQQFENTFFHLLNTHTNIVNSLYLSNKIGNNTSISEGRDCFIFFYNRYQFYISSNVANSNLNPSNASIEDTLNCYKIFFEKYQNNLGHYFRNLYHIIKFIDKSDIEKKKTYTNFVRAQLSSHELALLFYNCLSVYGCEKFKPLIQKYALLKNMNTNLVFNEQHLTEYHNI